MENIDWSKFNVKKNDEKQYEISKKRYIELINKLNKVNGVLISEFNGMGKLITVKIYDVIITKEAMYLFKNIDRIIDLKNEVVINNDIFLGLSQKENDKFGFRVKIKTYDDEFIEINTWDYKKFIKGRKTFYDKLNKNGDKALSGYKKTDISIKIFYKKCGHEEYITPELYCENSICPVCKKNMNTKYILDNYKEEAKLYFCDLNQLKNKVKSSKDSVDCKCKRCGRPIGKRQIKTVMDQHGLLCKSCGNGISMPNRIMFEILSELNKHDINSLNPKALRLLKNGLLRVIMITHDSNEEIKYDVFMRLNTGSVHLNEQELRNCLYRGNLNRLLKELTNNVQWQTLLGLKAPHKRMADRELILRFLAIYHGWNIEDKQLVGYKGRMKVFLNEFMSKNHNTNTQNLENWKLLFNETVEKIISVYGEEAFRRINREGNKENSINRAIIDILMLSSTQHSKDDLLRYKEQLNSRFLDLILKDDIFNNSLKIGTSDSKVITYRLTQWCSEVNNIVSSRLE